MERLGASSTTIKGPQNLRYFLQENSEERDYIRLLQQQGRMTKSPSCLPWEIFSGKDVSHTFQRAFQKFVETGRSKLQKKQDSPFSQMNLFVAAFIRHGASRSAKEADMIASIVTAPKSILYYA